MAGRRWERPRFSRFREEYLRTVNAYQVALAAGYSRKMAHGRSFCRGDCRGLRGCSRINGQNSVETPTTNSDLNSGMTAAVGGRGRSRQDYQSRQKPCLTAHASSAARRARDDAGSFTARLTSTT